MKLKRFNAFLLSLVMILGSFTIGNREIKAEDLDQIERSKSIEKIQVDEDKKIDLRSVSNKEIPPLDKNNLLDMGNYFDYPDILEDISVNGSDRIETFTKGEDLKGREII